MKMRWTEKEDQVLLENVKKYSKLKDALHATVSELKVRTIRGAMDRWTILKQQQNPPAKENSNTKIIQTEAVLETQNESIDLIREMEKILKDYYLKKRENEELKVKVKEQDDTIFYLNFEFNKLETEKAQLANDFYNIEKTLESSTHEHVRYIEANEKITKMYNEQMAKVQKLEMDIHKKNSLINQLKEEKAAYEQENNTIMNLFNKARKMFTGTDKEEKAKFKMDQNGNLERVI